MKRLYCCPRGNGGSKSTGCKIGLHRTSTWGHVSRRGFRRRELCLLREGCRIDWSVWSRARRKTKESERSLVAAALSKISAGVALLVRKVGVALLLCFYSGRRDVCLLSLLRGWFHVVEIGRVPSIHNIRSVSTMTTADSAMRIS